MFTKYGPLDPLFITEILLKKGTDMISKYNILTYLNILEIQIFENCGKPEATHLENYFSVGSETIFNLDRFKEKRKYDSGILINL